MASTSEYLIVGSCAALGTFALTYPVKALATKLGWVVAPDARRVHTVTTPDVGGIAMFAGVVIGLFVSRLIDGFDNLYSTSELRGVLIAATVMFLVGLLDDVREISAPA